MARRRSQILTVRELEVMNALWRLGKGTINEIREEMGGTSVEAYTTIATMLKFLESKDIVLHEQKGRSFFYIPKISKESEQCRTLIYILEGYFDGNVQKMIETIQRMTGVMVEEQTKKNSQTIPSFHGN